MRDFSGLGKNNEIDLWLRFDIPFSGRSMNLAGDTCNGFWCIYLNNLFHYYCTNNESKVRYLSSVSFFASRVTRIGWALLQYLSIFRESSTL